MSKKLIGILLVLCLMVGMCAMPIPSAAAGKYMLKLNCDSSDLSYAHIRSSKFSVTNGTQYDISFDYVLTGTARTPADCQIRFDDNAGAVIRGIADENNGGETALANGLHHFKATVTAPKSSTTMRLNWRLVYNGILYITNPCVTVHGSSTNLITNDLSSGTLAGWYYVYGSGTQAEIGAGVTSAFGGAATVVAYDDTLFGSTGSGDSGETGGEETGGETDPITGSYMLKLDCDNAALSYAHMRSTKFGVTAGTQYDITFDYVLTGTAKTPSACQIRLAGDASDINVNSIADENNNNETALANGIHRYKATVTATKTANDVRLVWRLVYNGILYIANPRVTVHGSDANLITNDLSLGTLAGWYYIYGSGANGIVENGATTAFDGAAAVLAFDPILFGGSAPTVEGDYMMKLNTDSLSYYHLRSTAFKVTKDVQYDVSFDYSMLGSVKSADGCRIMLFSGTVGGTDTSVTGRLGDENNGGKQYFDGGVHHFKATATALASADDARLAFRLVYSGTVYLTNLKVTVHGSNENLLTNDLSGGNLLGWQYVTSAASQDTAAAVTELFDGAIKVMEFNESTFNGEPEIEDATGMAWLIEGDAAWGKIRFNIFDAVKSGKSYTMEFDYYMPTGRFLMQGKNPTSSGDDTLSPYASASGDVQHFSVTFTATCDAYPAFIRDTGANTVLYVWNVQLFDSNHKLLANGTDASNITTTKATVTKMDYNQIPIFCDHEFEEGVCIHCGKAQKIYRISADSTAKTFKTIEIAGLSGAAVNYSFEYYLTDSANKPTVSTGDTLKCGHHTYTYTGTANGTFAPTVTMPANGGVLYVWGTAVSINGKENDDPENAVAQSTATVQQVHYAAIPFVTGDANNDAVCDVRDIVHVKRYLADSTVSIEIANADLAYDDQITAEDMVLLKKYLLGTYNAILNQPKIDVVGTSADGDGWIYRLGKGGIMVREVEIDSGKGGAPITFAFFSDCHIKDEKPAGNVAECLAYADNFDQIIIGGDMIEEYPYLNILTTNFAPYTDKLTAVLGSHETFDYSHKYGALEDRYAALSAVWPNNVYYASKVIDNKVMMIQMDNSQSHFWDSQIAQFSADLATARANGYTVLLFIHEPVSVGDTAQKKVAALYTSPERQDLVAPYAAGIDFNQYVGGKPASDTAADTAIHNLITNNGDLIKAVFTGHLHADFNTRIKAKTAGGADTWIPQYTSCAASNDNGHAIQITVK
ncbi:MAG: dockerin type I repeat-containing protein [Clostridia bacterium]|nr:dockerin type I repeat-containing protein [Clostridia bacterium]